MNEGTVIHHEKPKKWLEPVTALIMALATVGTAWCSYESAAWTRQSNRRMNEFNSFERQAGVLNLRGMQTATIHVAMFMEVLAAQQAGNQKLADFYVERFPQDVRKAYDAWIAQHPFENPNADPHPFVPNLYQVQGTGEAAESMTNAEKKVQEARKAGNISGQYLANTVLFAAVLFFANAAGKFVQRRVRVVSFLFAIAVFAFAVTRIVMLPR
ncbi:MAG TPA: hypothetical protein VKS98_10270 [Chthoniobacterales bacterium]|nr:hypothetical protein [Chthoniobacterales bacterium]